MWGGSGIYQRLDLQKEIIDKLELIRTKLSLLSSINNQLKDMEKYLLKYNNPELINNT